MVVVDVFLTSTWWVYESRKCVTAMLPMLWLNTTQPGTHTHTGQYRIDRCIYSHRVRRTHRVLANFSPGLPSPTISLRTFSYFATVDGDAEESADEVQNECAAGSDALRVAIKLLLLLLLLGMTPCSRRVILDRLPIRVVDFTFTPFRCGCQLQCVPSGTT